MSSQTKICVNALNGLSSFLQKRKKMETRIREWSQRPKRAFFISTKKLDKVIAKFITGVNALNGLSSFLRSRERKNMARNNSVSTP